MIPAHFAMGKDEDGNHYQIIGTRGEKKPFLQPQEMYKRNQKCLTSEQEMLLKHLNHIQAFLYCPSSYQLRKVIIHNDEETDSFESQNRTAQLIATGLRGAKQSLQPLFHKLMKRKSQMQRAKLQIV